MVTSSSYWAVQILSERWDIVAVDIKKAGGNYRALRDTSRDIVQIGKKRITHFNSDSSIGQIGFHHRNKIVEKTKFDKLKDKATMPDSIEWLLGIEEEHGNMVFPVKRIGNELRDSEEMMFSIVFMAKSIMEIRKKCMRRYVYNMSV